MFIQLLCLMISFFVFKQKTAYEMRISDWSADVCSSDLRVTTFPGRSKYQLVVDSLEVAGEGALMLLFEKLKARLGGEGLFDCERKQPLPYLQIGRASRRERVCQYG